MARPERIFFEIFRKSGLRCINFLYLKLETLETFSIRTQFSVILARYGRKMVQTYP